MTDEQWLETITELENRITENYGNATIAAVNYMRTSIQLRDDEDLSLHAVARNSDNMNYVPEHMKTVAFCEQAYFLNHRVFPHVVNKISSSPKVIEDVISSNRGYFKRLPSSLQTNPSFCEKAVMINPTIFMELTEEMRNDPKIALAALTPNHRNDDMKSILNTQQHRNSEVLGVKLAYELHQAKCVNYDQKYSHLKTMLVKDEKKQEVIKPQEQRLSLKL